MHHHVEHHLRVLLVLHHKPPLLLDPRPELTHHLKVDLHVRRLKASDHHLADRALILDRERTQHVELILAQHGECVRAVVV